MNNLLQPQQLAELLQHGENAIAILHAGTSRISFASDRFRDWTGLDAGDQKIPAGWYVDDIPFATRCEAIRDSGEASEELDLKAGPEHPRLTIVISRLSSGEDGGFLLLTLRKKNAAAMPEGRDATEQRLRSVIDSAPFPIALYLGREMRVNYANRSLMDVWGKGYDVIGKTYYEALPELRSQGVYEILDGVFTSGEPYNVRNQRIDLAVNGEMKTSYFNYSFTPLKDASGAVYGILNTAADVTDSNVARQLLEESELFTKSIIENSPVAKMVLTGEDMVIKTINSNMLEMIGRGREVIGMPFTEALPELKDSPLVFRLRHVQASGETHVEPEGRIELNRYGKPYTGYYNYIYKPLPNTSGEIYGVIITATEITDLVKTRKRIEEAQAALQGAIELAELATWSYNCQTGIVSYSQRLREWHGLSPDAPVTFDALLQQMPEAERESMRASFELLRDPGLHRSYDQEYTIRNRNTGATVIIHAQGRLSLDDNGLPLKWSGAAHDVTRERKAQLALEQLVQQRTEELATSNEELQTANEELAEVNASLVHSNEELGQYAYVASHDLQEPLRKIRLFSGMLQEQLRADPDAAPLVDRIAQSAARMHQLIRDLLEFSRLLKSDALIVPVNLNTIVAAVINDFELTIREKNAAISLGRLPVLDAVSLQMNQLFYNLIGNALKFSAPGRRPEVRISAREISGPELYRHMFRPLAGIGYAEIRIADNGIGLEPQYAEQIFEVFKRLHTRESYPGSGIGLALCRRIVGNHYGHLYVESTPGEGSTFVILLPAHQDIG